ncbi:hypothetical protein ACI65C_003446 [Semiaphis heraclei]
MSRATTQEALKRNLSSSSSSNFDTSLKKSKTFVSPNRFSALSVDDETPEVFSPPPVTGSTTPQLESNAPPSNHSGDNILPMYEDRPSPPIVIRNVINYPALKADFTALVGADGFTVTAKSAALIVKTRNCAAYDKLVNYCNDADLECHTWAPRHIRPFKVFIRNLHHTIPAEIIDRTLRDLGFSVISVSNVRHRTQRITFNVGNCNSGYKLWPTKRRSVQYWQFKLSS